uniref:Low density lipoprotein-related protein 1B n=1 Tax=Mus spicilegus TaxID=10103 RepID=A0A8C6MPA4_MUSSI
MSQLLLAILTLSGLLPNAEVLTVGANQGPVLSVPFPLGTFGLGCGFCPGIPSAADVGSEFAFL